MRKLTRAQAIAIQNCGRLLIKTADAFIDEMDASEYMIHAIKINDIVFDSVVAVVVSVLSETQLCFAQSEVTETEEN